jgi:hypothetical protein
MRYLAASETEVQGPAKIEKPSGSSMASSGILLFSVSPLPQVHDFHRPNR